MLRPQPMGSSSRRPLQFTHSVCNNIFGVNVKMTTQLRRVNLWCVYNEWTICGALQCNCKILSNVMRQLCWRGGERGGGDITAAKPQPVQATFSQTPPVHMLPVEFFLHCFTFLPMPMWLWYGDSLFPEVGVVNLTEGQPVLSFPSLVMKCCF